MALLEYVLIRFIIKCLIEDSHRSPIALHIYPSIELAYCGNKTAQETWGGICI